MPEVLEVEQIKAEQSESVEPNWDSWTVEIPQEIIEAQDLAKDSIVVLTIKDQRIEAEMLPPLSNELKNIAGEILKKRKKLFEELKGIGD